MQKFTARFDIVPFCTYCLIDNSDDINLTLEFEPKITAVENADRQERGWNYK